MIRASQSQCTALASLLLLVLLPCLLLRFSSAPSASCRPPALPPDPELSHDDLRRTFFASLYRSTTNCSRHLRSGTWDLCLSRALHSFRACLVISVTSAGAGPFEVEAEAVLGCRVIVFGPGDAGDKAGGQISRRPLPALNGEAWLSDALSAISEPISILVLDVGHAAWGALEAALRSGAIGNVRQLAVTLETREAESSRTDLLRYLRVLKGLEAGYGFQKWRVRVSRSTRACGDPNSAPKPHTCRHRVTFVNGQLAPPC